MLQAEPGLVHGVRLHQLRALMTVVELVGRAVVIPALGEHENVGTQPDRVWEDGDGSEVDIRVLAGGLACRGTVKVPYREGLRSPFLRFKGLWDGMH